MKGVVLDGFTSNPGDLSWEELEQWCQLTVYDRCTEKQALQRGLDAELIFTNKTVITKEMIEQWPKCQYIGVLATGTNVVDLKAATQANIVVTNVPGYSTTAVAQHVFALLLEITNQVGHHHLAVKQGRWAKSLDFSFWDTPLIEIADKTLGIVGYGQIGRQVAKIAQAFSMKVLAYDRGRTNEDAFALKVSLEQLWADSDIISLHLPYSEDTHHLINAQSIQQMKPGVILINTARGGLLDESACAKACQEGKIAALGLDVLTIEPPLENNLLIECENTVCTPHIAWAFKQARERLLKIAVENVKGFLNQNIIHQVN